MGPIVGAATRRLSSTPGGPALRLDVLFGRDLLADLFERAADQPRDVHLRDTDLLRDLRLRQPFEEAQVENRPLAVVEDAKTRLEDGAILGHLVFVLLGAEGLEWVEVAIIVLAARACRERERTVGASALERLEHFLLRDSCGLRELGNRRRARELNGQLLDQSRELDVQLLEPSRNAYRPAPVAEVTLDLADDVRRRVSRELDAAVDVEAVDRLDQADRADLDEVFELLAAIGITPSERTDERHVLLDQLLACSKVTLLVIPPEESLVRLLGHLALATFWT